jgi:hypothetical protein
MISQCTVQNNCDGSEGFTSNVSFFFNNTWHQWHPFTHIQQSLYIWGHQKHSWRYEDVTYTPLCPRSSCTDFSTLLWSSTAITNCMSPCLDQWCKWFSCMKNLPTYLIKTCRLSYPQLNPLA